MKNAKLARDQIKQYEKHAVALNTVPKCRARECISHRRSRAELSMRLTGREGRAKNTADWRDLWRVHKNDTFFNSHQIKPFAVCSAPGERPPHAKWSERERFFHPFSFNYYLRPSVFVFVASFAAPDSIGRRGAAACVCRTHRMSNIATPSIAVWILNL